MTEVLIFFVGGLVGAAAAWLAARSSREVERRAAAEKIALLTEAEKKLSDAFNALSSQALQANTDQFLKMADLRMRPLDDTLNDVRKRLRELEAARVEAYGGLTQQVKSLAEAQGLLRSETANLVKALRAPATRGRWGEIQLKRVVEMAGMLPHCDFAEQATLTSADGRLRPDVIIQLPGGRRIVVDSKAPLSAYLDALEAQDETTRSRLLSSHAGQVRTHIGKLAGKQYWAELDGATDFVVAFIPGEVFFSAALQADPSLVEYGIEQRVLVATPTTLIALLKAVAYGWRQERVTQNAVEISRLGREIYDRLSTLAEHFANVGTALNRATLCYNQAIGTLESRVLVSARRLKEKGVTAAEELPAPEPLDEMARKISADELVDAWKP
jgi:DNA recombination protein RmuC